MASLDLWLDGVWGEESAGWSQEVKVNVYSLLVDEQMAPLVSSYIQHALAHLAKELEALAATRGVIYAKN